MHSEEDCDVLVLSCEEGAVVHAWLILGGAGSVRDGGPWGHEEGVTLELQQMVTAGAEAGGS